MKGYKILNPSLRSRGFQYQEGLNIDTQPISPMKCMPGLHFASADDILKYCDYGNMIAEVEIPESAICYAYRDHLKADRIVLKNIRPLWDIRTITELIEAGVNIHAGEEYALYNCAKHNRLAVIKCLVEHGSDIHAQDDYALQLACTYGNRSIVEYLVEQGADIHAKNDQALICAVTNWNFEIAKWLIKQGADIHARDDVALRYALKDKDLVNAQYFIAYGADIETAKDYGYDLSMLTKEAS